MVCSFSGSPDMNALKPVNVAELRRMRAAREKIACLTCYDASFAMLEDRAGVDVILVGDSLGMVIQGGTTTTPLTVADIAYPTPRVAPHPQPSFPLSALPL